MIVHIPTCCMFSTSSHYVLHMHNIIVSWFVTCLCTRVSCKGLMSFTIVPAHLPRLSFCIIPCERVQILHCPAIQCACLPRVRVPFLPLCVAHAQPTSIIISAFIKPAIHYVCLAGLARCSWSILL